MKALAAKVKRTFTGLARRFGRVARWMAGTSIVTLAGLAAAFPAAHDIPPLWAPVLLVAMVGLFGAPLLWLGGWALKLWGRSKDARVAATDAGGLLVAFDDDDEKAFAADRLQSGMVVPAEDGAELRIVLEGGDSLTLSFPSVPEADRMLDALRLGPGQKRLTFRWTRLAHGILAAFVAYFVTSIPLLALSTALEGTALRVPSAFIWLVFPFLFAGLAARAVRREIVAGTDGVKGRVGLRRFAFRYGELDGIEVRPEAVVFSIGGETVTVPVDADDRATRHALSHRLEQAWAHFRESVGSRAEHFRRGQLSFEEWKARVAQLLRREGGMRQAPVRVEDAFRVLEDPEADVDARAGAALALATAGSEADRQRVRVAVASTASPKVRVALEAAAAGELEEETLERVGAEPTLD